MTWKFGKFSRTLGLYLFGFLLLPAISMAQLAVSPIDGTTVVSGSGTSNVQVTSSQQFSAVNMNGIQNATDLLNVRGPGGTMAALLNGNLALNGSTVSTEGLIFIANGYAFSAGQTASLNAPFLAITNSIPASSWLQNWTANGQLLLDPSAIQGATSGSLTYSAGSPSVSDISTLVNTNFGTNYSAGSWYSSTGAAPNIAIAPTNDAVQTQTTLTSSASPTLNSSTTNTTAQTVASAPVFIPPVNESLQFSNGAPIIGPAPGAMGPVMPTPAVLQTAPSIQAAPVAPGQFAPAQAKHKDHSNDSSGDKDKKNDNNQ